MKHSFLIKESLDAPLPVVVAAYLDCEHYIFLHKALTKAVAVFGVEGLKVTVSQSWNALGFSAGHKKTGEYLPPTEFTIKDVVPFPRWFPNVFHFIKYFSHNRFLHDPDRVASQMEFYVELELPIWLWPIRGVLENLIVKMHAQQNAEDVEMLKYREKLYGRENCIRIYQEDYQFLYHKDTFNKHFGKNADLEKTYKLVEERGSLVDRYPGTPVIQQPAHKPSRLRVKGPKVHYA